MKLFQEMHRKVLYTMVSVSFHRLEFNDILDPLEEATFERKIRKY